MLELRPNCECCDTDLPPDSDRAMICSFECTFCRACAEGVMAGPLPQLRRRLHGAPDPPGGAFGQQPTVHKAHPQTRRLRRLILPRRGRIKRAGPRPRPPRG